MSKCIKTQILFWFICQASRPRDMLAGYSGEHQDGEVTGRHEKDSAIMFEPPLDSDEQHYSYDVTVRSDLDSQPSSSGKLEVAFANLTAVVFHFLRHIKC